MNLSQNLYAYPILLIVVLWVIKFNIVQSMFPIFWQDGWDKIGHLGLYFLVTTILAFLLKGLGWGQIQFLFLFMCSVGIVHEVSHYFQLNRSFEFGDLAANFIGVVMSYLFVNFIEDKF